MWDELYKYLLVVVSSMFKFLGGVILGNQFGFPVIVTVGLSTLGMMLSIGLFTNYVGRLFNDWVMRKFYKNRKLFTKQNRRKVKIWSKFGLAGIAFLTPLVFTPIGGAIIANGFGESKERIFIFMLVSALSWAFFLTYAVSAFKYIPIPNWF